MSDLEAIHDHCKSFYHKAQVLNSPFGLSLYSYGTLVATVKPVDTGVLFFTINPNLMTCWTNLLSCTTLRHLKEFALQQGVGYLRKKDVYTIMKEGGIYL